MRGRPAVLIWLAAGALTLPVAAADATRVVHVPSHISIASHELTFTGKVTAGRAPCVSGRRVTLVRTNGNILGHATTNAAGRWTITAEGSAGISLGHFFARVARRSDGTAGTIFVCGAAVSRTIPLHM